jgi:hypothetical protein
MAGSSIMLTTAQSEGRGNGSATIARAEDVAELSAT